MDDLEHLTARIYEAAAVPELWLDVLERLNRLGGGLGASVVASAGPGNEWRWVATREAERLIRDHATSPIPNTRVIRGLTFNHPGFMSDPDIFSPDELETDPFLVDFLRPRGAGWCIGTIISAPSIDPIALAIERRYEDGPPSRELVDIFDALRPHLARAALWSAQLAFERTKAMTTTLDLIGLPAAVLDPKGRLTATNARFDAIVPGLAADRRDRLRLHDPNADDLLEQALATIRLAGTRSIAIPGSDGHAPTILHLLPVHGAAHDVFAKAGILAVMTPIARRPGLPMDLLQGLFDLTPAEARVARRIVGGESIDALAGTLGLSRETIRSQLRSAMSKIGVNSQVDLVRLIAGSDLPIAN